MKSSEVKDLMHAFEEATSITFTLVAMPIILLLVGLFVDKTFSTTPLFIFLGIIAGVGIGMVQAMRISKRYKFIKKINKDGK